MKRFFSAFLAALMIVMTLAPVPVGAADPATVTVTASKATANVGEEIVFTVNIKNAVNVSVVSIIPQYDKNAFEMISGEVPKATKVAFIMDDAMFIDGGFDMNTNLYAGMFEPAYTLTDVDIFTFTLKAKKTIQSGTVSCTLPSFVDGDNTAIPNTVTPTTVSVVCEHTFGGWEKHNAEQHKKTCSACGEIAYEAHKWDAGVVTTPPTHLTEGEKTFSCTVCGEKKTEKIAKTTDHAFGNWTKHNANQHKRTCECGETEYANHNWDAGTVTKPASHIATGIKTYKCTECGETKTETLPKTEGHGFGNWTKHNANQHKRTCECGETEYANHNWDAGVVTKEPTCKDTGIKTYTCKDCGETKTESIAKTNDHKYGDWVKDTATDHKHICEVCGKAETAAHKWNAGEITKPASHVATGIKTYTCTECGETKTETLPKTDTHGFGNWEKHNDEQHKRACECGETEYANHNWDAGVVTTAPTCKDTGIKTYTCKDCGATKTEVLEKTTDHKYGAWTKDSDEQHKHVCDVCGKAETATHNWNAGVVTTAPTCKDTGIKTYTCTDCGATKTETLEKTTDHKWDAGVVTTAPTCKDTGVKTHKCTVCGETKTEIIPTTTTHTFGAWAKDDANVHTHICEVCGKSESRSHAWDKGVITVEPSAGKDGEALYTCTVCGETKTVVLSATHTCSYGEYKYNDNFHWLECSICLAQRGTQSHNWVKGNVIEEATHTQAGKVEYVCSVCQLTKVDVLPLIAEHDYSAWTNHNEMLHVRSCECGETVYDAHAFGNWVVIKEATVEEAGLEQGKCSACGATAERTIDKLTPTLPENVYQVTFHNIYGAASSEYQMNVTVGKAIVFDLDMEREGYLFGGWYLDEACTKAFDISMGQTTNANINLYARWIQKDVAISITVEGVTTVNEVAAILAGEKITAPAVVLNEGEKVEWYLDADFTIPFNFDDEVDYVAFMTLYAKIVTEDETEDPEETTDIGTTETTQNKPADADSAITVVGIVAIVLVVAAVIAVAVLLIVSKKRR